MNEQLKFLRAVLQNAGTLLLALDAQGRIRCFNHACERLSGYCYAEAEGKRPWDFLLPQEDAETSRKNQFEALRNNPQAATSHCTGYWISKQGERALIEWSNTGLFDADGTLEYMVSVGTDVTERIQAPETVARSEQALMALTESLEARILERTRDLSLAKESAERANFAKSQFLSRMSHELRTPMNAILGFAQVLELETTAPELKNYTDEIHRAGRHLLKLINELLDLSRIETGHLAVQMQTVQLDAVLSQAVNITHPLMATRQISLLNDCNGGHRVLADSTRLCQILINLLSNATKYNRCGGRISIACQRQDANRLRIAITDTGTGIAPDKLPRLFRPFERLGAEHSDVDGIGIGLALSKQLAELMGANIGVESSPGQGSTFWLDVSLASPSQALSATAGKAAPASAETPTPQCTVLYIEDNPSNLKLVEVILRRQPDLTLMSATNGEDGLNLARRHRPDVILLDIHLPGMNGYEVLAALKADAGTCDIPVLALSADAMAIDIEHGLSAGFHRYITKPIEAGELIAGIRKAALR